MRLSTSSLRNTVPYVNDALFGTWTPVEVMYGDYQGWLRKVKMKHGPDDVDD